MPREWSTLWVFSFLTEFLYFVGQLVSVVLFMKSWTGNGNRRQGCYTEMQSEDIVAGTGTKGKI